MLVYDLIKDKNIPDISAPFGRKIETAEEFDAAREDIIKLLESCEYGTMPKKPLHLDIKTVKEDRGFCAGKAVLTEYMLYAECEGGTVSYPFYSVIPQNPERKPPVFLHINFRDGIPDKYQPTEEIIDRGYAVFTLCYTDVTSDDGDFRGNARILTGSRRRGDAPGKIALWAWAAMRVIDYIVTRDDLDTEHIAAIGHSRLGKTSLLLSAYDSRVKFVCANGSGTSGDAVIRTSLGERFADIVGHFDYWFCPNFKKYVRNESALPFDQHFLISLSAPRHVYIGAAKEDLWADPRSQFLGLYLTRPIYALYGLEALPEVSEFPEARSNILSHCGYHQRFGTHYLSREDWNIFMDSIDKVLEF